MIRFEEDVMLQERAASKVSLGQPAEAMMNLRQGCDQALLGVGTGGGLEPSEMRRVVSPMAPITSAVHSRKGTVTGLPPRPNRGEALTGGGNAGATAAAGGGGGAPAANLPTRTSLTSMAGTVSLASTPKGTRSLRRQKQYAGFGSTKLSKRADREIAALEFLLNIPMQNEAAVLVAAMQHSAPVHAHGLEAKTKDYEEMDLLDSPHLPVAPAACEGQADETQLRALEGASLIPGRRLDGPNAYHVRVPMHFRYRYHRLYEGAAVVRQWEGTVARAGLVDGRHFYACNRGYPLAVGSVIRYKPGVEEDKRLRAKQADERGAEAFERPVPDWRGVRYCSLLHAEWAPCCSERDSREGHKPPTPYDPLALDDPSMSYGKNRQVTVGDSSIGPVVFSVILFVNPRQLKDELNKQFRDKHPELPPSLTLSKIRSLKRQALNACRAIDIEIGTLAMACVYFEKLCLKQLVTKSNRRLAFGACLTLAYKFHEQGVHGGGANKLPQLLDFIDREWYTSNKQIFEAEFGVLYHLDFGLHCQLYEVSHHFSRLLKMIECTPKDYLGDDMYAGYLKACLPHEEAAAKDAADITSMSSVKTARTGAVETDLSVVDDDEGSEEEKGRGKSKKKTTPGQSSFLHKKMRSHKKEDSRRGKDKDSKGSTSSTVSGGDKAKDGAAASASTGPVANSLFKGLREELVGGGRRPSWNLSFRHTRPQSPSAPLGGLKGSTLPPPTSTHDTAMSAGPDEDELKNKDDLARSPSHTAAGESVPSPSSQHRRRLSRSAMDDIRWHLTFRNKPGTPRAREVGHKRALSARSSLESRSYREPENAEEVATDGQHTSPSPAATAEAQSQENSSPSLSISVEQGVDAFHTQVSPAERLNEFVEAEDTANGEISTEAQSKG